MKLLRQTVVVIAMLGWLTSCSLFGGGEDPAVSMEPGAAGELSEFSDFSDSDFDDFGDFEEGAVAEFDDDFFFDEEWSGSESVSSEDAFATMEEDLFAQELGSSLDDNDFLMGDDFFAEEASGAAAQDEFSFGAGEDFAWGDDFTGSETTAALNEVTNIEYLAQQGGTLVVETAHPVAYRTRRNPTENQVVLELPGVRLPSRFERPFITRDFGQNIVNVTAYFDPPTNETRVVVQMAPEARFQVDGTGGKIVFTPEAGSTAVADSGGGQFSVEGSEQHAQETTSSSAEEMANNLGEVINYTGKPINIEVDEVEIRYVLRMIAEEAGINLIIDETVDGKISLKLREVPWDQALALILKTKQLGFSRQGSVLRITTQDRLAEEQAKQRRLIEERVLGEPMKVRVVTVSYAQVEELQDKVQSVLSQRGKVVVDPRTASLVISDVEEYLERADRLVKSLDVAPRQVLIEGKVVEARETFAREIGVNFNLSGTNFESGSAAFNINTSNSPATRLSFIDGFGMDLTAGTFDTVGDLNAFLGLREKEEKINVISSPRVVTLNNMEAEITQKTQIPVVTSQPGTPPTFTTEFKDIQLQLKVLPQITFEGNVILQVSVLREFPDSRTLGGQDLAINSRSANTSVLVPNGQTAVIGGIYQSDAIEAETGTPFLKNIPLLGNLFKYRSSEHTKNELLIFLTPRILQNSAPVRGNNILSEVN